MNQDAETEDTYLPSFVLKPSAGSSAHFPARALEFKLLSSYSDTLLTP